MEGVILNSEPDERHIFVIKFWQESEADHPVWRGRITHVISDESLHFVHLREIQMFIGRYLPEAAMTSSIPTRLRRWFRRRFSGEDLG